MLFLVSANGWPSYEWASYYDLLASVPLVLRAISPDLLCKAFQVCDCVSKNLTPYTKEVSVTGHKIPSIVCSHFQLSAQWYSTLQGQILNK